VAERKIIRIAASLSDDTPDRCYALCDDGSTWQLE
jgi:hypothetical protein